MQYLIIQIQNFPCPFALSLLIVKLLYTKNSIEMMHIITMHAVIRVTTNLFKTMFQM